MPRLGLPGSLVILLIIVLIFGAGKLPEVGAALGKAIRGFREASCGDTKSDKPEDHKHPVDPGNRQTHTHATTSGQFQR